MTGENKDCDIRISSELIRVKLKTQFYKPVLIGLITMAAVICLEELNVTSSDHSCGKIYRSVNSP